MTSNTFCASFFQILCIPVDWVCVRVVYHIISCTNAHRIEWLLGIKYRRWKIVKNVHVSRIHRGLYGDKSGLTIHSLMVEKIS